MKGKIMNSFEKLYYYTVKNSVRPADIIILPRNTFTEKELKTLKRMEYIEEYSIDEWANTLTIKIKRIPEPGLDFLKEKILSLWEGLDDEQALKVFKEWAGKDYIDETFRESIEHFGEPGDREDLERLEQLYRYILFLRIGEG